MPEIKNTFIQGKMNKDLDPRIIPPGEYVDAKNIKVSRSENGDIGVVENILSNKKITNVPSSLDGTEVIGHVVDFENKIVYYFLTDFDNANENIRTTSSNKCAIVKYNDNNSSTDIVFSTYRFNFNKSFPINGVNILDGFLFFTDNLNQPRVFNVEDVSSYDDDDYFEDKISVAKYAPYCAPKFLSPEYILTVNGAVNDSTTITISAVNTSLQTAVGNGDKFLVRHDSINDDIIINSLNSTTLVLSEAVTIADGEKLTILGGSMFENTTDSTIDSEYLKEKFVRFSYRYKYKDNTYSLFAPFTQIAFIPKINNFDATNKIEAYKEAEIADFINKVNQLELEIMLPTLDPIDNLFIKEIEILLKESDSIAVKVLDVIDIDNITELRKDVTTITKGSVGNTKLKAYINNVYSNGVNDRRKELYYVYRSEEPFKTLPESQTNRVYDNVPVKALAQEIAGNRIIYGNFVEGKQLPTNGLNYELSTGSKNEEDEFTYEEYPRHTLKQNRTYVVGVVLADRYGRQSPVLLSSKHSSSILHKRSQISTNGDSLKVIFNEQINENLWSVTNPLGWYSYRIVVKQTKQEYYNVYIPGVTIFDVQTRGGNTTGDTYGYFPIYGDNINKIPRDEVTEGSNIDLSTSSVNLYGVVENGSNGIQTSQHSVIAIGDLNDFGITDAADTVEFYDPDKKYLFAQIKGNYGTTAGFDGSNTADLAVFETEPFKSKLDLFFETSSCGLISELNAKINEPGGSSGPDSLVIRNLADTAIDDDFAESVADDTFLFILKVYDSDNNELTVSGDNLSISIQSVSRIHNNINIGSANDFSAENDNGVIKLKLVNAQQYLNSPANAFELVLRATTSNGANNFTKSIYITNVAPDIGFIGSNTCISYTVGQTGSLATVNSTGEIYAYNGSASNVFKTQNLQFSKVSGDSRVNVAPNGVISLSSGIGGAETNLSFVLRVTDEGGLTDTLTVPLCQDVGDVVNVPYGANCSGTSYNYYDRCYGAGENDPGDKYEEYFCPDDLTYNNVTGHCNGAYEDVLSNHQSVNTTTQSGQTTISSQRYTQIFLGGKANVDGGQTGTTINIKEPSTDFLVVAGMSVTGSGISANTTVTTVNSQSQIVLSNSASVADNAELTFKDANPILDAANTDQADFFIRIAPHANDTPGKSGYVGSSDSNFIVAIDGTDYEYIVGAFGHSGLYADVDGGEYKKMVRRSTIQTTLYTG